MIFGNIPKDGPIPCPSCGKTQARPVILIGRDEYSCLDCRTKFGSPTADGARCPECGQQPGFS
ncbi:MAG: hypothetical protein A3B10_03765 [Candidatus Doudnabacteria bacterium RIFCSPLOWO2_01_FULL_44_21]|uniref:Uncharacterized protein n=1 Tax=Candidatus Doudnabacteria bacterium RIFCSPLOWO2_01_FULL_44_21 TaxID=1817841 RepID=A0A1F5PYF3_9BACT|nr:MAG: hypothetical protein A3B95_02080 [Candidatus Doudnabacteria bacterium RIFCSPHIGHO2_02_FULL_43_13b]OGE94877.1 MAG: hypothetical protein A3B10_03765 [Candidatus Doudnabacteria bacterium RIFCSPLOWO2_01_FULL_44_21]